MAMKLLTLWLKGIILISIGCNAEMIEKQTNNQRQFDMDLFQRIARPGNVNILISPLSLKILLGMIMEGGVGETAAEIRTALTLPQDQDAARQEVHKWMTALISKSGGSDIVRVANRIFLDKSYTIKSEYLHTLERYYHAGVTSVRKENPQETADIINSWVKRETNGMIPFIILPDNIGRDFVLAEGNAIYFKGKWKYLFKSENTKKECFYQYGYSCGRMDMMAMSRVYIRYADIEELDAKAINLPYKDETHSMLIVLPAKRNGIDSLIQRLRFYPPEIIISKLSTESVTLKIPKFTVEYTDRDLVSVLRSMNVSRAFSMGEAQLFNMVNERRGVHFSKVIQKTKIIVDEEGTEAAAATLGSLVASHGPIYNYTRFFIADHPFLYFIRDQNHNVLFAGRYDG